MILLDQSLPNLSHLGNKKHLILSCLTGLYINIKKENAEMFIFNLFQTDFSVCTLSVWVSSEKTKYNVPPLHYSSTI